jgi:hypothetical protein
MPYTGDAIRSPDVTIRHGRDGVPSPEMTRLEGGAVGREHGPLRREHPDVGLEPHDAMLYPAGAML